MQEIKNAELVQEKKESSEIWQVSLQDIITLMNVKSRSLSSEADMKSPTQLVRWFNFD